MALAVIRALVAYFALFVTVVLCGLIASAFFGYGTMCPTGTCTTGEFIAQVPSQAILYAYTFGLISVGLILPFLVIFLLLSYLNAMRAAIWAVIGVLTAIWLILSERAFGGGVNEGGGWAMLVADLASPLGAAVVLAGIACGLAVWGTDRRMKGVAHG